MSMAMDMTVSNNRDTGVVSVKDKLAQQITRERSTRRRRTINVAIMRFALLAALLVPWQLGVEYGLINTLTGLIFVYTAIHLPLTVYILDGFFSQIPQDLYDAAKMDGYSNYEIFWRITLPVGLPAISTVVILNLIDMWNEFLYAVVLITADDRRTLPLGIMKFLGDYQTDYALLATGLMISVIPVILLYAFFSERVVRGMTAGAVK